jgi:restriction system protein
MAKKRPSKSSKTPAKPRRKKAAGKDISSALRHWRKTRRAERALEKVRTFDGEKVVPRVLAYLRKLDPFVFEEILLCALNEAGYRVRRNRKYTGDGGVDGRLSDAEGNKILLQAKRYSGYVKASDVDAFSILVERYDDIAFGIFFHTGRTGPKSHWKKGKCVTVISGNHLVRLLLKPEETWLRPPTHSAGVASEDESATDDTG